MIRKLFFLILATLLTVAATAQIQYSPVLSTDAFNRLRVSNPTNIFDGQFTYDRQPLLFDTITGTSAVTCVLKWTEIR